MKMQITAQRGMTIVEMIISLGIMLVVLGLATALFKQAYTHNTLTSENMSNEQIARVAIAKINSSLSQASSDTSDIDFPAPNTPAPPIVGISTFPSATATPAIAFYRVAALAPAATLPIGAANQPDPAYYVHIISYDPVGLVVNEYSMPFAAYGGPSPAPTPLASHVTDFQVQQVNGSQNEYRISITIQNNTGAHENAPEAPYTLVDNVHLMQ